MKWDINKSLKVLKTILYFLDTKFVHGISCVVSQENIEKNKFFKLHVLQLRNPSIFLKLGFLKLM